MADGKAPSGADSSTATRHFILGTAGHIDHGKTSLIKALTGTDTDRLPEEKRRGMTIELGFAALAIGPMRFGVVDVPGHERFVRTMVAGATGIDVALIVVAADDSVMPQTVEHVDILELLGVSRAVVAVTKIDAVEADLIPIVLDDVKRLLDGTPFATADVVPVSSVTGAGLDELKDAIRCAADGAARRPVERPFRMAIDRVFTVQGRGTVVTGSVLRGTVAEGDVLELLPTGRSCRVRGLQAHGTSSGALQRGQRAAINLSGIDRELIHRGHELATPGYLQPAHMIDVRLRCLKRSERPMKSLTTARLEIGATDRPVRIVLLDGGTLAPGESDYAQLRAGEPITAAFGQRFIIRDASATRTVGGGTVIRPAAVRVRGKGAGHRNALERLEAGDDDTRLAQVLREAGFRRVTNLQLCARTGIELSDLPDALDRLRRSSRWGPVAGTDTLAAPQAVDDLGARLAAWLERFHRNHPDQPGKPIESVVQWLERCAGRGVAKPLLAQYEQAGRFKRLGRFVCAPTFAPSLSPADEKALSTIVKGIREGGFQPPAVEQLAAAAKIDRKRQTRLTTLAIAIGELVRIDAKTLLHADAERDLRRRVADLIRQNGGVTVADVREALGSSRKFVVPFLEYLDRVGFTKRTGDLRVLSDEAVDESSSTQ